MATAWKISSKLPGAGRHCMCGVKRQAGGGSTVLWDEAYIVFSERVLCTLQGDKLGS